jgi:uncharacterized protein
MTYIKRNIQPQLEKMLRQFPVLSLTGPRQSGKTTLLLKAFPNYKYYNLERLDYRQLIMEDPIGFLKSNGPGIIFDEAQNLPELFSYIQVVSDENKAAGQYVLSGSQSFLMNQHISQSLAGRVFISHLLPFCISEVGASANLYSTIHNGFYPRLVEKGIIATDFYPSYLHTYVERDVRTLKAIEDLNTFTRFLALCAGRIGQILNLTSLANDVGVAVNTVKSWISLLEASYIIFLAQPYHNNFSKRIIRSPKLYFFDTGVACSLLRIGSPEMLKTHYLYGSLFENMVISDICKQFYNLGKQPNIYFWRESNGTEVDCILEFSSTSRMVIEIKAGQTFSKDYIKNLKNYPDSSAKKVVVYAGEESISLGDFTLIPWTEIKSIVEQGLTK